MDEVLYYTVQLAKTPADMAAFWTTQLRSQPEVSGPWKAGFWYAAIGTLYVYANDTHGLTVNMSAHGRPAAESDAPSHVEGLLREDRRPAGARCHLSRPSARQPR